MMISNMAQTFNCCKARKRLCQTVADAKKLLSFVSPLVQQVATPEDFAAHIDIADWLVKSKGTVPGDEHRIQSKNFLRAARYIDAVFYKELDSLIEEFDLEVWGVERIEESELNVSN